MATGKEMTARVTRPLRNRVAFSAPNGGWACGTIARRGFRNPGPRCTPQDALGYGTGNHPGQDIPACPTPPRTAF